LETELGAGGVPFQSQNRQRIHDFDWDADTVRLLSLHSAKGLEFPQVIILGLQVMPQRDETLEEATRLLYGAMTRATQQLTLTAARACPLGDGVAQALESLAAKSAGYRM
jgi:superfamily I DNA/RNA helicase